MLPAPQMRALYDTHPAAPWELVTFPDAGHMDAYDSAAAQYWPALASFVERHQADADAAAAPGRHGGSQTDGAAS